MGRTFVRVYIMKIKVRGAMTVTSWLEVILAYSDETEPTNFESVE